ncbi:MAG: hypothetical protein IT336_05735 [Thermomicrobiales bacterium]|nr:hypothetical protein [Thermomicrobiales bacterium]
MSDANRFLLPFTPPRPHEVVALRHAAAYLKRAAVEIETRRMAQFGRSMARPLEDDLPTILRSAGLLCETVVEIAPREPSHVASFRENVTNVPRSV